MEENNDIFLAGSGSMTNFSTSLILYAPEHILDGPPPFPQLRAFLIDGLHLNQKINKNIRISYSLQYKHLKKKSLQKNEF